MTALKVGQVVVALHPICGHLHIGSILALYKENQIMVKFQNPELGVQKVFDINISSEYNLRRTDALGRETFQFANQDVLAGRCRSLRTSTIRLRHWPYRRCTTKTNSSSSCVTTITSWRK